MNSLESIDISNLSTNEKLGLMEMLWRDLSKEPENIKVPQWHLNALEDAEKAVADGTDEFVDLEEFEAELRDQITKQSSK